MKLQDYFSEAYYINLDKRTDRRESFEKELSKYNLNNFVQRFSASMDATHTPLDDYSRLRACSLSHYNLIKLAKEKNLKNILIFEDDAFFYNSDTYRGIDIVEAALDDLQKFNDWHVFHLGGLVIDSELKKVSKNLLKANSILTTHAYAFNNTIYDFILNKFNPHLDSTLDGWLSARNEIIKYIVYPVSVPQTEGYSDCDAHGKSMGIFPFIHTFNKTIIDIS
jgi:glycosyl transferase family 25